MSRVTDLASPLGAPAAQVSGSEAPSPSNIASSPSWSGVIYTSGHSVAPASSDALK